MENESDLNFEFWGGIGGHLEQEELNFPMKASYREIEEETGYKENEIENFTLKYILIEESHGELRQQYVYFSETHFIPSDEGELYWIHKSELLNLNISKAIRFTIQHYLANPDQTNICVGAVTADESEVSLIQWSTVKPTSSF
nr:NUDIX domain-containing protein [Paenibacillus sp. TCA20]